MKNYFQILAYIRLKQIIIVLIIGYEELIK